MTMSHAQLKGLPILSLQSGEVAAYTKDPVIIASSLQIAALTCQEATTRQKMMIRTQDIRQLSAEYVLINSEEELVAPQDIVRLRREIKAAYNPVGQPVMTESGRRLGVVKEYLFDPANYFVTTLNLRRPVWFIRPGITASINRSQIVDVTINGIIVRDATVEDALGASAMPESAA